MPRVDATTQASSPQLLWHTLSSEDPLQNQGLGLETAHQKPEAQQKLRIRNQHVSETGASETSGHQKLEFGNRCGSLEAMLGW